MNSPASANIEDYLRRASTASREQPARDHALTRSLHPETPAADALQVRDAHGGEVEHAPDDVFRGIRTRLLSLGGAKNFTTLVTAVSPRSGASFVARNLAAAFAFEASKSALLIDCNVRRASQHVALGIEPTRGGLLDYLEQPQRTPQQVLYRTRVPRLSLLPAGQPRATTGELFSAARMRALVDALRVQYPDRYLLLDGPALGGSPDALLLSEMVDYVVIVAAFGRDSAASINQAIAGLDPKKVAGAIFNHPV